MSEKPLSPNAAAKITGVSRSAIMRALANKSLFASRDNKNRWLIQRSDLDTWASDRPDTLKHVRTVTDQSPDMSAIMSADLSSAQTEVRLLREQIEDRDKQLDEMRADRAKLLDMMTQLTQPKPSFWARILKPGS